MYTLVYVKLTFHSTIWWDVTDLKSVLKFICVCVHTSRTCDVCVRVHARAHTHTHRVHKSWVQGDKIFCSWHLMLVCHQYGRRFVSLFWHPEFWGAPEKNYANTHTHTHTHTHKTKQQQQLQLRWKQQQQQRSSNEFHLKNFVFVAV
jgi:hypothetical protein